MLVKHQHHNQPPPTTWIKQHGIHITTYTLLGGTNQLGHICVNNSSTDARKSTSNRNQQQKKNKYQHQTNNLSAHSFVQQNQMQQRHWTTWMTKECLVCCGGCLCLYSFRASSKRETNTVVRAGGTPTPQTTTTHNLNQTTWNTHHHLRPTRWYIPVGTHMCKQQ